MTDIEIEAQARGWWPTEVVDERGRAMWARPDRPGLVALEDFAASLQRDRTRASLSAAA